MKLPDLGEIQRLYDENRFIDAYSGTEELWARNELAEELPVEGLVLAARLAARLGGCKLRRWLLRTARAREPDSPLVRYFSRGTDRIRFALLDDLREFEEDPSLNSGVPDLDASWLGDQAVAWGFARVFDKAHDRLRQARELGVERPYLRACEAAVLSCEDRFEDALDAAEEAWSLSPGMPTAAHALAGILARLGRSEEVPGRILDEAPDGQSHEVLDVVVGSILSSAERAPKETRRARARDAYEMAGRAADLALLADRDIRSLAAWRRLDAAFLMGDRSLLRRHAAEVHSPFFKTMAENLAKSPDALETVLPYRWVRQVHDTCLPASVATVLGSFDIEVDLERLAEKLTWGGTAAWRIQEWAEGRGLAVRQFTATPELARALIDDGVPFVLMYRSDAAAHAIAAVGLDRATGTLVVHDPAMERLGRVLLSRMGEYEEPFGPRAMALVPGDRSALLDRIPAENAELAAAWSSHQSAIETEGPSAASAVAERAVREHPDAPEARYLSALDNLCRGNVSGAFDQFRELAERHPLCIPVRASLLNTVERIRNTAQATRILADVVERGLVSGIRQSQPWIHPPAEYLARYADYLSRSASQRGKAHKLLRTALKREPLDATTLHILGDTLWLEGRYPESVLPYLMSACLNPTNEHYAWATSNAYRKTGREEEGLAFLADRAERSAGLALGSSALITRVEVLIEYGRPEEAVAIMEKSESDPLDSPHLDAFAVQFWSGLGRWGRARAALGRVEESGHRLLFHEAATRFHEGRGHNEEALRHCRNWLEESTDQMEPRRIYLTLVSRMEGQRESLALAKRWCEEQADHEGLEELLLDQLNRLMLQDEREDLLWKRVERNPEDGIAMADLGYLLIDDLELLAIEDRKDGEEELEGVVAECERIDPDGAGTLGLRARLEYSRGRRDEAVEGILRSLRRSPGFTGGYNLLWDFSASMPRATQEEIREQAEKTLLSGTGTLHAAGRLSVLIAGRFGAKEAEASVARWLEQAPGDPLVLEAMADLLIYHGEGSSDARRAIGIIEDAVRRFPHHTGLKLSLADAWGRLQEEDKACGILLELLRHEPLNSGARHILARALSRSDRLDEAIEVCREGVEIDTADISLWMLHSVLLGDYGRLEDAARVLEEGLARNPDHVGVRERLIYRLLDVGQREKAIEVARAGTTLFPDGSYMWFLLGQALSASRAHVAWVEVEEAYRRSLELNAGLYLAADELAVLLADQRKFDEARDVIRSTMPLQDDPSAAQGRLAWISRRAGEPDASRRMLEVLREYPRYEWGWRELLLWIEQDEDWNLAREALEDTVEELREYPVLDSQRLEILALTGRGPSELDEEWIVLIENYPSLLPVHLRRFDNLLGRGKTEEAVAILDGIERFHPASAFILARRVQALGKQEGAGEEAVEVAMRVFAIRGDHGSWPDDTAWKVIAEMGPKVAWVALQEAADRLEAAEELRAAALSGLVENAKVLRKWQPRRVAWGRPKDAELQYLERILAALQRVKWNAAEAKADVLRRLSDGFGRKTTLRIFDQDPDAFRRETPVWSQIGDALVLVRIGACRKWLSDWRDRVGVEMWAIANYGTALRKLRAFEELYESSRDVLDLLAHDNTTLYHVCNLCEAAVRLQRDEDLLLHLQQYRKLLRDPPEQMWLHDDCKRMPEIVALFGRLITSKQPRAVRSLTRQMARVSSKGLHRALRRRWLRRLRGRISWFGRLLARFQFFFEK